MAQRQRVFITGYGAVSPIDHFHDSGDVFETYLSAPERDEPLPQVRRCEPIDPTGLIPEAALRRMDRFTQIAFVAVLRALRRAGMEIGELDPERIGMIFNTCYGPFDSTRAYLTKLIRDGARKAPAAIFPNTVHNAFTGLITLSLRMLGTSSTVSGYNPLCYGVDMIRDGRDDAIIVGGCDELIDLIVGGFESEGLLSQDAATPSLYHPSRNSLTLGEGAAVIVVESAEHAHARSVVPIAEILDYGIATGSGDVFPADAEATRHAIEQALERSGVAAEQVGLVSAGSNGLAAVREAETAALEAVFAGRASPWITNAKTALGETLAAGSTFSAITAAGALFQRRIPPNWGIGDCDLPEPYLHGPLQSDELNVALVNGYEMGGTITSFVLRRVPGPH